MSDAKKMRRTPPPPWPVFTQLRIFRKMDFDLVKAIEELIELNQSIGKLLHGRQQPPAETKTQFTAELVDNLPQPPAEATTQFTATTEPPVKNGPLPKPPGVVTPLKVATETAATSASKKRRKPQNLCTKPKKIVLIEPVLTDGDEPTTDSD